MRSVLARIYSKAKPLPKPAPHRRGLGRGQRERDVGVGGEDEVERAVVNFKLCKRYCDYHLRVHRYRDRSAEEVREEIETVLERMRVASQDDKAAFLAVRMEKLLTRWDAKAETSRESSRQQQIPTDSSTQQQLATDIRYYR